jgi:ribonuclease VapC
MVIDTSALIAILRREPEMAAFRTAISSDAVRLISAVTKFEASMVTMGRGLAGVDVLDNLLDTIDAVIVPFDDHQATIARGAFARYGKGRHPAALNFGDCAAYALARAEAEPLLFKGTDFGATDVEIVALPG